MKIPRIGIVAVLSVAKIFGFASCGEDTTYQFHSTVTYLAAGTDGTCGTNATYCYFGDWPQTIKEESVTVDETKSVTMGSMTYYLGSDSNYYAKCTENAYYNDYTYSDGTTVAQASENIEKYFKVEPIKWRVLNPSASGNKILLAESILTTNVPYYDYTEIRTIDGKDVYTNNYKHSIIRAYLNGLSFAVKEYNSPEQTTDSTYNGKGFLQTAFTSSAQALIADTVVDNSAASTNPASNASEWNSGTNDYACENTSDKIFLLSEKEATTSDYGFTEYNKYGEGYSRIRVTTDYAKANHAYQSFNDYGGWWWLRSPSHFDYYASFITENGNAARSSTVHSRSGGVVPALSISTGSGEDTTYQFHSTVTYLAAGTDGTCGTNATYCYFGDWPQTIKEESVTVDETKSVTMGSMTYYLGSDSNYYAKCMENAYADNYTYSDGTTVSQASANSEKYFKVEPIKWRVLNPSSGENKILVAESILTANVAYYDYQYVYRTIDGKTVYPNNYEHSKIRAYLNGLSYTVKENDSAEQATDSTYNGNGFLQTAFTSSAQALIADTVVDNSAASTNPASNASELNSGTNDYACDNTSDKIFLLSEKEATTSDYGFTEYDVYGLGNSRIRVTTDYAKANYAYRDTDGDGDMWWLRSPEFSGSNGARYVCFGGGNVWTYDSVHEEYEGVVPALSISAEKRSRFR